ncbi:FecR family protein [Pedobacter sp. MC2016-14]|uniref:FecR family protein n=1 Tax=Pedobacter sp. MC2016-14 TaxID=2897327 RepID=UPI001E2907EB|nr:FecR family protein [Pedobacter sp. MC2016-14]MCD0488317.1 FecR family protein [Pedobacter sp. MC2016-14]
MTNLEAEELFAKIRENIPLSEKEQRDLDLWYLQHGKHASPLRDPIIFSENIEEMDRRFAANFVSNKFKLWSVRFAVAASVILLTYFGLYFYEAKNKENNAVSVYANDVAPGGHKATLTLSNGRVIKLDSAKTGVVIDLNTLSYNDGASVSNTDKSIPSGLDMTITTPKGGEYQITLSDGTRVWLNANSTLKFSNVANATERKVYLLGEAYFEVSKVFKPAAKSGELKSPASKEKVPFTVLTDKQEIQVLGTHFNVNSYPEEPAVKTTLLEGSVLVSVLSNAQSSTAKQSSIKLGPGQQAILKDNKLAVKQADVDDVMAWKNGYFLLYHEDFKGIMDKISRWYNVEVIYKCEPTDIKIGGLIPRTANISTVLEVMEQTGKVHFKIEGRRVTVLK